MGAERAAEPVVVVERGDDGPTIRLTGEIDLSNADLIRGALSELVASDVEGVHIEAGGLRFIDSSGLAALVTVVNQFGPVQMRNASANIRRLVEVSGLAKVLRLD